MTCTNCVLDRSDKSCPVLTEIDLVVIALKTFLWATRTGLRRFSKVEPQTAIPYKVKKDEKVHNKKI